MSEFERSLAIVIGINRYQNGISPLQTAAEDAKELSLLLALEHNYEVVRLLDEQATRENLRKLLLEELPREIKPCDRDRVLFYFAGHGIALNDENGPAGYLVPQDAKPGNSESFLPMQDLHDALIALNCRHLIAILDCCFAGTFRWSSVSRDLLAFPEIIHKERYDRFITDPAWQAITSAGYDQKALDVLSLRDERGNTGQNHSPFAQALFNALRGGADIYPLDQDGRPLGDGVITAQELIPYLRHQVEQATEEHHKRQTPGLWPLKKHDKGEYIFLVPGHPLNLPPAPELNKDNNPYRGLEPFEEKHSKLFFGRNQLIEQLLSVVTKQALTVVLGASGTGKSSLVKAGLIPRLRSLGEAQWHLLPPMRPGESPFSALARAILSIAKVDATDELERINALSEALRQEPKQLSEIVAAWSNANPKTKLLLVIDQFEELVTLCRDDEERQQFMRQLEATLTTRPEQLRLVQTLRSDFEPQFLDSPLKPHWMEARFIVPPMTQDELRQAIERPASERVLYFESDDPNQPLVDQLINEVVQMPGALPLLSFTLSELYLKYLERRGNNRALTENDYRELGGVAGSLTRRATQEYNELVQQDPAYKHTIRQVMLRMVAVEGGGLARRRVPKSELVYLNSAENERVREVIRRFSAARLIVEGQEPGGEAYAEPAHDALVRGWDKLRMWINQRQKTLTLQQRLTPAANDWLNNDRAIGYLWADDPRIELLAKVAESDDNWLNHLETEFINSSIQQRRDELKEAEERRNLAVSRQLAAQAELARSQQVKLLPRSILLAVESMRLSPSLEADQALRSGLNLLPRRLTHIPHQIDAVAFSPNGQYLAIVTSESEETVQIQVCKADTGEKVAAIKKYIEVAGVVSRRAIVFSPPDGKYLATVTVSWQPDEEIARLEVWEVVTGNEVANIPNLDVEYHSYISQTSLFAKTAFSPNGKFIATVCVTDNTQLVRVWEIETGQEVASIPQKDKVDAITFSQNGEHRYLAATNLENTAQIRVWNAKTGNEVAQFRGDGDTGWVIGFSSDGQYLATKSEDSLQVWEVATNRLILRLSEFNGMLQAVTFSPDGKYLSTLSGSRKNFEEIINPYIVQVWEVNSGTEVARVPHHSYSERNFACSSDAKYLATGIVGGIQVWEMSRGDDKDRVASVPGIITAPITLSWDGKYLATVTEETQDSDNKEVKVWEAATGHELASIPQEDWNIGSIALSSDGKYLATTGITDVDGNTPLNVWEVATKKQLYRILQETKVEALAFSANGEHLYTASLTASTDTKTQVRAWETSTGKELATLLDIDNSSPGAFSLDGKYLVTNLTVLEVSTAREVGRLSFENFWSVDSIALSPDGQYLAMKGIEDTEEEPMYIWEVSTGRPVARITSQWHFGSLALSQRYLALQVLDTVHIFLWRPEDLINEACTRLNRNLTPQEWRQYFPEDPYRKICPNLP